MPGQRRPQEQVVTLDEFLKQEMRKAAQGTLCKYDIPLLAKAETYDTWKYCLSGIMEMLMVDQVVDEFSKLEQGEKREYSFWAAKVSPQQAAAMVELGSKIRTRLDGSPLNLVAGKRAATVVEVLRVLDEAYGEVRGVDKAAAFRRLFQERYGPKEQSAEDWIAAKHAAALRLPDQIPAGTVFEANMRHVLLELLPAHFGGIVNELRASNSCSWRYLEQRIVDFDKTTRMEKSEVSGALYNAVVKKDLRRCFKCGKVGHVIANCRARDNKKYTGGRTQARDQGAKKEKSKMKEVDQQES